MEISRKVHISRISRDKREETDDFVAAEKRLRISVNGENVLSLYCSPVMVRELVVGVVHNEGLISGEWCTERISIVYGENIEADIPAGGVVNEGEATIASGCAGGVSYSREFGGEKISDEAVYSASDISGIFRKFQQMSDAFRETGGIHSAALTDGARMLSFAEDIGRHNAVDKVIGALLLENHPFQGTMMLASGRLSSDIVRKCIRCRIPVIASRAAPTSLAVELSESAGLTLIGFLRGDRMNVYSSPHRVRL